MLLPKLLPACLLFITQAAAAQPAATLRFEKVNGLSQNTVYSIMKDKQGFMWIATADGLNRYDGMEMKVYKPPPEKKPGQIRGRTIRTIVLEDNKEQLWFSSELSVFGFDKKRGYFQEYLLGMKEKKSLELTADPIAAIDKTIWFANSSSGVIALDKTTSQSASFTLTDSFGKMIYIQPAGVFDNNAHLWFASNKGLFAFDINTKKWQQFLPGHHLYKVAVNGDMVYAISGKEIFFYNTSDHQTGMMLFYTGNNSTRRGSMRALYTDYLHNTWAGDDKGNVYCKKKDAAGFDFMGNINGERSNQTVYPVYCFYADTLGTLWVGADVLGLLKAPVNATGFNVYPEGENKKEIPNFFVSSIYRDRQDRIWLGTFQMGLVMLNKKNAAARQVSLPGIVAEKGKANSIGFIKEDNAKNLWIGTAGNLFVREQGTTLFKKLRIPLPSNSLSGDVLASCFTTYKDGWLLGTSQGLYFLKKSNNSYVFEYLSTLGMSRISEIWIDKKETLWIAFEGLGLFVAKDLAHLKECTVLFAETGIKSFLYEPGYGLLWISTLSGLVAYHLETATYKNFAEADGLGNSFVYGALRNKDELWLSTNRGLSKALISFKKGAVLPTLNFTNFTSNDGLPDDEFNTGAFYKDDSGNFYFGTIKGVVWFNPQHIQSNHYLPEIVMTGILVNGQAADSILAPEYISDLQLPYFKNNLFFRFRGLEYSNASRVSYAYQLQGWDKDWVYSSTLNEVRYNNLPHGSYTFKVKAANASGIWNKTVYTISIKLYPPFWKTWWFYLMEGLLVAGVIIFITKAITSRKLKNRIEKLERQKALEKERQRISQEMHDDIGAGLTQISLISEAAKLQTHSGLQVKSELDDIAFTSRQLVDNISEIIWALNPQNNTLDTLLAHLREQLHKLLEYAAIEYSIHFPLDIAVIHLDDKRRRNIVLVTKEIVHNAIKHSNATTLTIEAVLLAKRLTFVITDNGSGFDHNAIHKGNGLKNISRRMEELQGTLLIKSGEEKGTVFNYAFKL